MLKLIKKLFFTGLTTLSSVNPLSAPLSASQLNVFQ